MVLQFEAESEVEAVSVFPPLLLTSGIHHKLASFSRALAASAAVVVGAREASEENCGDGVGVEV